MENKQEKKSTPLHKAALHGNLQQARGLAKQEASFNKQLLTLDENDNLPLDRAAPRGHYEIVKMLVDAHKKPGNEYVMYNKQNYYPFLSAVRWYLKVLDESDDLRTGTFNTGESSTKDYMNIIRLLAQEYPEHMTKSDSKGCNATVYAMNHFNEARIAKDPVKVQKIKEVLEFLISNKVPVQKDKLYYKTWHNVERTITAMEKNLGEEENVKPQYNQANNVSEKKTQTQTNPPKPTFFSTQQVKTTVNQKSVTPKK